MTAKPGNAFPGTPLRMAVTYRPDQYPGDRRTFVVLGAPRGGTSVIAGAIQLLGVPMGSTGAGQHEDPLLRPETPLAVKQRTIAIRNSVHAKWGWKLPNTVLYYNQIRDLLINPVFVVVLRNPLDVMMSAVRHDKTPVLNEGHFQAPFGHYFKMSNLIRENPHVPVFLFSYEAIIARRDEFIDDLTAILQITPTPEARATCLEFVSPTGGYKSFVPMRAAT